MFNTLYDILSEHGIQIAPQEHRHAREGWINFDCPFCGKGTGKFHMGFNEKRKNFTCWRCGGHKMFATLKALFEESDGKTKYYMKCLLGDRVLPKHKEEKTRKLILPKRIGDLQQPHIRYIRSRGFNYLDLIRLWDIKGIGFSPSQPQMSWRIFIPIIVGGRMVSWTSRATKPRMKRYKTAMASESLQDVRSLLYGQDHVVNEIVVCEGIFDAWRIGPGATATLTTSYTQAQVNLISQVPVRVICFDNEPRAQMQAHKLCNDLAAFPGETYNVQLTYKDTGEIRSWKEAKRIRQRFLRR